MKDKLKVLNIEKPGYDKESQTLIESLNFIDSEINTINEMKSTAGWKLLSKKIRTELHSEIRVIIKDNTKIQTLLALLTVADTKSMSRELDKTIEEIMPDK